ncbi:MAG TPA: VWA domain-containing protein [Candidatus Limnocylindrales bacterium]|jgi:Ca-activated chloride channel family protein
MTFLAPAMLVGLLLVPLLVLLYLWAQRRRTRYAVRFTNLELLANLAPRRPGWRRHLPPVLALVAIALLAMGLARPTMLVPVPRDDAAVILAIDISGSMKAEDVAPTRLDAARAAAQDFVDGLPAGVRVGVVAFASQPVTLVSPTSDRAPVRAAIAGLRARDGTAMGDALMQVLDLAEAIRGGVADGGQPGGDLAPAQPVPGDDAPGAASPDPDESTGATPVAAILLSDGANSTGEADPLAAAERAAALGVPIHTIALGTAAGRVTVTDENGQPVTLEVPPDTETLQRIADTTGGTAFDAPTADELAVVYEDLESRLGWTTEEQEATWLFAAGALILVVAAAGLSALWFGRLP